MFKSILNVGFLLCGSLLMMPHATAVNVPAGAAKADAAVLRAGFEEAERAAARANEHEFAVLYNTYSSYPLWPYIESVWLQNNLGLDKEPIIRDFFSRYAGTVAERQLRHAWLNYLIRQNEQSRFIRDYINRGSSEHACRYLAYRYAKEGASEDLWDQVDERWLHGRSQPRACNGVFSAWQQAGRRTPELTWQRLELALAAREWSLTRYLTGLLPESERALATQALQLRQRPASVADFKRMPAASDRAQRLVEQALRRLVWQSQERALQLWPQIKAHFEWSEEQLYQLEEYFAVALALRGHEEAQQWFARLPVDSLSESGQHWQLANLLRDGDFNRVLDFIDTLPPAQQDDAKLLYWRARSLDALQRPLEATTLWKRLAEQRNYYGFMASAHLQQMPELSAQAIDYDSEALEPLLAQPEVQRAYEFLQLGRLYDARREWNLVRARASGDERKLIAILAGQWQWFDQSIRDLAELGFYNDVTRRFPLGYGDLLQDLARHHAIDPAWAFAIVRRESAFQSDAISPVGARGLMQVMPDTAEYLTRRAPGRQSRQGPDLYKPEQNVQLGTRYLQDLLQRNQNNWLLATASYNAGIYRVREWIPEQQLAADVWIETIPYQETRDYVKAVLAYQQIYTMLLGRDDNILEPMHSMRIYQTGGLCQYGQTDTEPDQVC
ncbi:transglycosylase SLT domain-containing protein [Aliidiomarina sp. Khilg15.8]